MAFRTVCYLIITSTLILLGCKNNQSVVEGESLIYTQDIEARIDSLGLILPDVNPPIANYVNITRSGNLLYLAGKGPKDDKGDYIKGKLGYDTKVEEGYAAARNVGLTQLSVLKSHTEDLDAISRIVKVTGMVNAVDTFTRHPEVINGFSDLMVEVFGERGRHARVAVGMSSLPRGMICEIEMIVELKE